MYKQAENYNKLILYMYIFRFTFFHPILYSTFSVTIVLFLFEPDTYFTLSGEKSLNKKDNLSFYSIDWSISSLSSPQNLKVYNVYLVLNKF